MISRSDLSALSGGIDDGRYRSDIEFLNDLDRGNYDCQRGETVKEDESDAYYIGYGARYVLEQNQSKEILI